MKKLPKVLKEGLENVFFLPPNDLGVDFLNRYYKKGTACLKVFPWIFIPLAISITVILFLSGGQNVIILVNYLCSLN